jgi:hypothetical protein
MDRYSKGRPHDHRRRTHRPERPVAPARLVALARTRVRAGADAGLPCASVGRRRELPGGALLVFERRYRSLYRGVVVDTASPGPRGAGPRAKRTVRASTRRTRGTRDGSARRPPRGSRDRTPPAPERGAGSGGPEQPAPRRRHASTCTASATRYGTTGGVVDVLGRRLGRITPLWAYRPPAPDVGRRRDYSPSAMGGPGCPARRAEGGMNGAGRSMPQGCAMTQTSGNLK